MSLERIDPFEREDLYALDHLLRYDWAAGLVGGCSCVDVACGLGFGSVQLRRGGAREVVGVDRDAEAVAICRERWEEAGLGFRAGAIETLGSVVGKGWDRVVCFETLEHVEDPETALRAIESVMAEGGIVIGSVPGETDLEEENEYHLHHFDRGRLEDLLGQVFRKFQLYEQRFQLGSLLERAGHGWATGLDKGEREALRIELGGEGAGVDTYLFVAGQGELPEGPGVQLGFSRAAWRRIREASHAGEKRGRHLQEQFRKVFFENGALKRRIAGLLAWGRFNFQRAQGWEPECGVEGILGQIERDQVREWREKVEALQAENARLRVELGEKTRELEEFSNKKRTLFADALQSGNAKGFRG